MSITSEKLKADIAPVDFYRHELGDDVQLKKYGWNDGGLCPFHADNKTGSFRVNRVTGAYKCFACDAAGWDIIAFTMDLHGLNFTQACDKLVNEWGLT